MAVGVFGLWYNEAEDWLSCVTVTGTVTKTDDQGFNGLSYGIWMDQSVWRHHWLLVAFAILFGACHCTITYMTHKEC